jgi:hypothetical protein
LNKTARELVVPWSSARVNSDDMQSCLIKKE